MKSISEILGSADMAQFQHQRGDVLSPEERAKSARQCLQLLSDNPRVPKEKWSEKDRNFFKREYGYAQSIRYAPSDRVLQWLRDMKDRYAV